MLAGAHPLGLDHLLAGISDDGEVPATVVSGLSLDSRRMRPGYAFVALKGARGHGLDHATEAVASGAAAILWEPVPGLEPPALGVPAVAVEALSRKLGIIAARFHDDPSAALEVIGVTGTNGKTSCAHLLAQALAPGCGLIGTLGYGFPGSLQTASLTTPDAITLQSRLAEMAALGAGHVVMEVSSHALAQHRVDGTRFAIAVFTNLSRDHLDYHGTMADYLAAKQRLFGWPTLQMAVINGADPACQTLRQSCPADCRQVLYGLSPEDVRGASLWVAARRIRFHRTGLELAFDSSWGAGLVEAPLIGEFNAANLLAVVAVLLGRGMAISEVLSRLSRIRPVPGRMALHGGEGRPTVVVDYAHTPDALAKSLAACRRHVDGRLWCIFGCGGERDRGKRALMGQVAAELADQVVLTDDNPRGEDPGAIIEDILGGMPQGPRSVIHDRRAAIESVVAAAEAGDWVLVAGKGHERFQLRGLERLPFDDAEVVTAALSRWRP